MHDYKRPKVFWVEPQNKYPQVQKCSLYLYFHVYSDLMTLLLMQGGLTTVIPILGVVFKESPRAESGLGVPTTRLRALCSQQVPRSIHKRVSTDTKSGPIRLHSCSNRSALLARTRQIASTNAPSTHVSAGTLQMEPILLSAGRH